MRSHHHVIHIGLHISPYHGCEHSIHQPLVGGAFVLQPKGHHRVTIARQLCHERRLAFVHGMHLNLFIPKKKHPGSWATCNPRHCPPRHLCLVGDRSPSGMPSWGPWSPCTSSTSHLLSSLRVLDLPYVVSAQQLLRLFFYGMPPLLVELSSSLADRSDLGVHRKAIA